MGHCAGQAAARDRDLKCCEAVHLPSVSPGESAAGADAAARGDRRS
jgi:hypothetical protein